jgi:hypothetical protein
MNIPTPTPGGPADSETLWERVCEAFWPVDSPGPEGIDFDAGGAEFARILADVEREATRRERERAAGLVHATKEETIRQLIHGGYDDPRRMKKFVAMMDGLRDMIAPAPAGGPDGGGA